MPLTAETAMIETHKALQALLEAPSDVKAQAQAREAVALCERYWEALEDEMDTFYAERYADRVEADLAGAREWDCAVGGGV